MKALKTTLVSTLCGWLSVGGLHGQNTITPPPSAASHLREVREKQNTVGDVPQTGILRVPRAFQGRSVLPAGPLLFLASGEGRGLLEATHHPLAQYLSRAFGGNAEAPIPPSPAMLSRLAAMSSNGRLSSGAAAGTVPCTGSAGARFNLEPRANAVLYPKARSWQTFIPNGVAQGDDLIVQAADDFRGNLAADPQLGPELERLLCPSLDHCGLQCAIRGRPAELPVSRKHGDGDRRHSGGCRPHAECNLYS